jgi:hypothetical protein
MAGSGGSGDTDQLAQVADQDTVAMDPRTMFDATEEIPPEQLHAVRRAHAARDASRGAVDPDAVEVDAVEAKATEPDPGA